MDNKKKISKKGNVKKKRRCKHYPYAFSNKTKAKSYLGGGCFGKIYLMKNHIDNQTYAVKHFGNKNSTKFINTY